MSTHEDGVHQKVREAVVVVAKLCSESDLGGDPQLTAWAELNDLRQIRLRDAERALREHWPESTPSTRQEVQTLRLGELSTLESGVLGMDFPELRGVLV